MEGREPIRAEMKAGDVLSTSEALLRFMSEFAIGHYKNSGQMLARYWEMVEAVRHVAGEIPTDAFRGKQLKMVRAWLLSPERVCKKTGRPLSRTYVNYLTKAAQRCWKWLLSEGDVSADCAASVAAVEHLRRGGRETKRIMPPPAGWDRVLPTLSPTLRAMVEVQECGGMRPQDVCGMRRRDISTSPEEPVELPGTGRYVSAFPLKK